MPRAEPAIHAAPVWAEPGAPEAPLRRSYTEHMAAMEAAGWGKSPAWDELTDQQRDLWAAIEDLRGEDIAAAVERASKEPPHA